MTNPSKAKGTRWENAVAAHLRGAGYAEVYRLAPAGADDCGDLGGIPEVAFECRDRQRQELARNLDDANDRARCKGSRWGVAVMKRPQRPTEAAYVLMDLATFVDLLGEALLSSRGSGAR